MTPTTEPIAPAALRTALGRFATGVTIVTCIDDQGERVGLTANSFNSLSLDPPLVLWSLRANSQSVTAFRGAAHFVVNVLSEAQVDLSRRFASPVPDKFSEGLWTVGLGGAPVLSGCAAVLECERFGEHVAGDHVLFIGRVCQLFEAPLSPLVFQSGRYHLLGEIL
jgi:4-hydroxyphenylacetate 3-hydroxylase, reductase component